MPSTTRIPLLLSSAAIRTPAPSLSPAHPTLPGHTLWGTTSPQRGLGPPLRPRTQQGPSDTLWRQQPALEGCHCLVSIAQLTQLLSKPGKLSRTISQPSCPSRADQAVSSTVGDRPCRWVMPNTRPHELPWPLLL